MSVVVANLPHSLRRLAPVYFDRYGKGMHYAVFKKNKHTQWYVFFTMYDSGGEVIYLIRYISNNHVVAHLLEPV